MTTSNDTAADTDEDDAKKTAPWTDTEGPKPYGYPRPNIHHGRIRNKADNTQLSLLVQALMSGGGLKDKPGFNNIDVPCRTDRALKDR
jgi:hypothetical protein